MQHRVDPRREHIADAITLLPGGTETVGILATTIKAGPMPGSEGSRLIEKEQLGPASPFHHLAPAATEIEHTGQPGVGRPALPEQRFRGGAVDDAAIADKHAGIRNGENPPWWQPAVFEGRLS